MFEGSPDVREIGIPGTELEEEEQLEWAHRLYLQGFERNNSWVFYSLHLPYILQSKLSREIVEEQEVKVRASLQLEMMTMTSVQANQLRVNLLSPV